MSDLLSRAQRLSDKAEQLSSDLNGGVLSSPPTVKNAYIAGPMSGLPDENRKSFHVVDVKLSNKGIAVLNPALLPDGLEQSEYMDICCAMVRSVDMVFMLKGWQNSEGFLAEYHLAKKLGKKIIYHEDVNC